MDYYIDKHDFKVYNECPGYFSCDAQIAPIIAKLMSLGYEIITAGAGHYEPRFNLHRNVPKEKNVVNIENCKANKHCFVITERKDSFDYWDEHTSTYIHILFKREYEFDDLPEGFILKKIGDGLSLMCQISYYNEDDKMKRAEEILNELDNKRKLLEAWVDTLPKIREG